MPTQIYRCKDGKRVPGNTTVIGRNLGWSKDALMYWAWQQGIDGKDFRQSRDAAAGIGTHAHALIEADIKQQQYELPKDLSKADVAKINKAFENYCSWHDMVKLELVTMEVAVISEFYRYGTTLDILARVHGELAVVEVKTSNSLHEDYLIQVSAQKQAWEENYPDQPITGLHVLRLNKEQGSFTHSYYDAEALVEAFKAFKHLRALHDLQRVIKGML